MEAESARNEPKSNRELTEVDVLESTEDLANFHRLRALFE